jgi:histo-blood group ABO system transferase
MCYFFLRARLLVIVFSFFLLQQPLSSLEKKVAFCILATGKYYKAFAEPLIISARKFFLKGNQVTYVVFTDQDVTPADDVKWIYQKKLGWPYDALMRYPTYFNNKEIFEEYDYIFSTDADMLFVADVGDEILGNLVGTLHPGFYATASSSLPYETREDSTACVGWEARRRYFAGALFGGTKKEFLKMISLMTTNIRKDLDQGIIAVWHDESHLNKYFIDHPPTVTLSPSYCYAESEKIPFVKRYLALDKNHEEIRN